MITEYHRPDTLEEALALLARVSPRTVPLGGGTILTAPSDRDFAVVDLQNLGLNDILVQGQTVEVGATTSLQALFETSGLPLALVEAVRLEATQNLRNVATVAGALIGADGRSPFAVAMLALDARLTILPGEDEIGLGDVLNARASILPGKLVTAVKFHRKIELTYDYVARSRADRPIVALSVGRWPSGRVRIVLGGWGLAPRLAMDAPQANGAGFAVSNAAADSGDAWASADYRQDIAKKLLRRVPSFGKDN